MSRTLHSALGAMTRDRDQNSSRHRGMAMSEPHTFNIYGGTGGVNIRQGQGGDGGVWQGPIVNFDYGHKEEERKKIIDWLSPINFFLRHADISQIREKGTGGWLLAHPLFKQWESGSGRTLWCHGIPGAGKTVLVSMIVDHLRAAHKNNRDIGVACIYLNHKEVDDQTPSRLLAGLWRQLVLDRDISSIAEDLYKQHQEKGTAPSLEEVVNVLKSSIKEFSKVFIIVDAMDEYPEFQREILLQQLADMGSNVNLMITSRPNISPEYSSFPNLETLDIQAAPEDIQEYINAQIKLSPCLSKHIRKEPMLQEKISMKIIDAVDGMFLLAKLYIDSLSTKNTIWAVQEALNALPEDIYGSYDIAMQRIDAQSEEDRKTAHSTLIWVANAKRPLKVSEITAALAIEPGDRQLDRDNVLDIKIILSVCAGLVIVDKKSSVVRLVHYTTQEYLDSIQALLFPDAQTQITQTLLTFLAFDGYPDSSWKLENLPPLVEYSQYCLAHVAGQPEVPLRGILLEFLCQAFQWKKSMNPEGHSRELKWNYPPWNYSDWPSQPSVLWIAAAANLVETTKLLIKGTPRAGNTEIIVASYYGHKEIVTILLENDANVNTAVGFYGSPLQAAAAKGHIRIVSILLDKSADVNAAGGEYGSPLQAAAAGGHIEIVCILLDKGANVNVAGGEYGSPLEAAAARGHTEIVCILLDNGADVNAAGGEYGSPLQTAASQGYTEIACILLDKGADVNAAGGEYGSPLQAAAARGHKEIFCILLDKGADVNAAGGEYGSSLQAAAVQGHTEIVGILLEKGADINAAGGEHGSLLQAAAYMGHKEIVHLLLENGADVNAVGRDHGSSLQVAAAQGRLDIDSILLEKYADVNAAGGEYGSALQAAAAEGHTDIVRILLEKGAKVNAAGREHGSALQAAAAKGHTDIVRILLKKGANVNAEGGQYGTALQAASYCGHDWTVYLLLQSGANANAKGGQYVSPLEAAASQGHKSIVLHLIEKGADMHVLSGRYGAMLQAALSDIPILTFVIYSPESLTGNTLSSKQAQYNSSTGILPEDIHILETQFSNGGSLISHHSPHDAVQWVEAHFNDILLKELRTQGLGGPMAVMLSPEESALVIFGSILDSQVHEAAKSLADESHFTVMIRPLKDDPIKKWSRGPNIGESEGQPTDNFDSWEDDTSISGSSDEVESIDSEAASLSLGSGVYRFRGGGAGNSTTKSTPAGPPHHLDVDLQLKCGETLCSTTIICQTKFTCHTQYLEGRPQVISSTMLTVIPEDLDVQPDRSYSKIGFLAHGYISYWKALPFDEHIPLYKTNKHAAITPKWIVDYKDGVRKRSADQSYVMQDVSYAATDNQQDRMEVRFSMGIDVEPNNHDLPKMSFIIQNLTFLFVHNKDLQALGYGMAVVTSSYIPDVQTDTQLRIREPLVVDVAGDSVNITTDPVKDAGPLSVSLGFPATQENSKRSTRYLGFCDEGQGESQLSMVPLHEIRSRGWDIMMEQWRKPVCPKWGNILQQVLSDQALSIGNMKSQMISGISEKTQHEPGPPPMGADNMETQDMMEEEKSTHNSTQSKGKQHDPALQAEGTGSNIQDNFAHNTLPGQKHLREEADEGTWEQGFSTNTASSQATHMAVPRLGSGPTINIYTQSTTFSNITGGFGGPGGSGHTGGEGGEGEGPRLEGDPALNSRNVSGGTGGIGGTGTNIGGKGGKGGGPVLTLSSPHRQEEEEEFPRS